MIRQKKGSEFSMVTTVAVIGIISILIMMFFSANPINLLDFSSSSRNALGLAAASCTDSDGGKDYFTRGRVEFLRKFYYDNCTNTATLNEKFCSLEDGKLVLQEEFYTCAGNSCSNGACRCGNGVVEPGEDCDKTNLAGKSCVSIGFSGGNLLCNANCKFDTTGCDTAIQGSFSASSQNAQNAPALAADGDDKTSWCAAITPSNGVTLFGEIFDDWWQMEFSTPQTIGSLHMKSGMYTTTLLNHKIRDFAWTYQKEGSSEWVKIPEADYYANRYQLIFRFEPVTNVKKMRLLIRPRDPYEQKLGNYSNYEPCLREVTFYYEKNADIPTNPWFYYFRAYENEDIYSLAGFKDTVDKLLDELTGKNYADNTDVVWVGEMHDQPIKGILSSDGTKASEFGDPSPMRKFVIKDPVLGYQEKLMEEYPVASSYAKWIDHEPAPAGFISSGTALDYTMASAEVRSGFYNFMRDKYDELPIFGICGGHQIIAQAMVFDDYAGFASEYKPNPDSTNQLLISCPTIFSPGCGESGFKNMVANTPTRAMSNPYATSRYDMLFNFLDKQGGFKGAFGHYDEVDPELVSGDFDIIGTYPKTVTSLNSNDFCLTQAIKLKGYPIYGTQYHPDVRDTGSCSDRFYNKEGLRDGERLLKNFMLIALNGLKSSNLNSITPSRTRSGSVNNLYDLDRESMWCAATKTSSLLFDLKNPMKLKYIISVEGSTPVKNRATSYTLAYSNDKINWVDVPFTRKSLYSIQKESDAPRSTCTCDVGSDKLSGAEDDQTMLLELGKTITAKYLRLTMNGPQEGACMREIMFLTLTDVIGESPQESWLLSPRGIITDATPTFQWKAVPGATSYNLWINYKETIHDAILYQTYIPSTSFTLPDSKKLANDRDYGWYIMPNTGASSQVWSEMIPFSVRQEFCNNQDDDSDGTIDEGCDDDNDGFWDSQLTCESSYKDGRGTVSPCQPGMSDLDDTNPEIGSEKCNSKDDDGDGTIDEGCDDDKDGFWDQEMICEGSYIDGNGISHVCARTLTDGLDTNPSIGHTEVCNNRDDDGDGMKDNGCDDDLDYLWDGNMICDGQYITSDCEIYDCLDSRKDSDDTRKDPAPERCNNYDDDLDGEVDEGCDDDGDGYYDNRMICYGKYYSKAWNTIYHCGGNFDALDTNPKVTNQEICNNWDDNKNGIVDEGCDDDKDTYWDKNIYCDENYLAGDGNVYPCEVFTMDADDGLSNPRKEICNNKDDTGEGLVDEGCDDDEDGYWDYELGCIGSYLGADSTVIECKNEMSDALDSNPDIKHEEVCNNRDDDNDGIVDDGCDDDGDEFWDATVACVGKYLASTGKTYDCKPSLSDADDSVFDNREKCNNADDDGDGVNDNGCDDDGDTFWDGNMICSGKYFTPKYIYDCKPEWADLDDTIKAIGSEKCNNKDDDLDKTVDEGCDDDKDTLWDSIMMCDGIYLAGDGKTYTCIDQRKDADDTVFNEPPGETCNNVDDNTNSVIDEGCDDDGDTFWDATMDCVGKYLAGNKVAYDCRIDWSDANDSDRNIKNGEICNNKDDTGNNIIDEGCDDDKDGLWDATMTCWKNYLAADGNVYPCNSERADSNDNEAPPVTDDIQAHYKLDEGSGSFIFNSAGSVNGTINGNSVYVEGVSGMALEFDGITGYAQTFTSTFDITNAMSIEAWVKTSDANNREIITKALTVSPWTGFTLRYMSGKVQFRTYNTAGREATVEQTLTLADNNWHHLAGTYDGAMQKLYIDGVLINMSVQTGGIGSNTPLSIGYDTPGWTGAYFKGTVDEIKIYNKALTAEEVNAHFLNP